jgi:hypothetical protein
LFGPGPDLARISSQVSRSACEIVKGTILEVDCMELTSLGEFRYPIVTVPLGFDETIQEPVCLYMIGRPFSEGTLVQLM